MNPELVPKIIPLETGDSQTEEKKLFTLRDIEGKSQFETVEKIGRLGDFLREKDPRIVGVSVVGSTVKGYALPESERVSDVDIILIFRSSESIKDDISYNVQYRYIPEFEKDNDISIHLIAETDVNNIDRMHTQFEPGFYLRGLFYPFFGDRAEYIKYINEIKNILAPLSIAEKRHWATSLSRNLVFPDSGTKARERLGVDEEEYLRTRTSQFEKYLTKLFFEDEF